MDHVDVINSLLARGNTQADLERLLHLSPNYISKLRHRAATPSFQLSALLAVIERHPEVISTIETTPRPAKPAKTANTSHAAQPSSPRSPTNDLFAVLPIIEASGARYGLLGIGAHIADDGEIDLVVHAVDRHVLPALREAGFDCVHYSSSLFECYAPETRADDDGFRLHFPFLPPLKNVRIERKLVRGVEANVIVATDTALNLLLSRREDGLEQARRLVDHQLTSIDELRQALAATHALPQTRSTFTLMVFDRDLAAQRLAEIEGTRLSMRPKV